MEAINGGTDGQALCSSTVTGGGLVYGTKRPGTGCMYAQGAATSQAPAYHCGCGIRSELSWSLYAQCLQCTSMVGAGPFVCRARATGASAFVLGWLEIGADRLGSDWTCHCPAFDGGATTNITGFKGDLNILCNARE